MVNIHRYDALLRPDLNNMNAVEVVPDAALVDPQEKNEELVKHVLVGAAGNRGVEAMYLGGRRMESRPHKVREHLQF